MDHVFWVRCEQYASFVQDFGKISEILRRSIDQKSEETNEDILLRRSCLLLEDLEHFLLVLDNTDDLDSFLGKSSGSKDLSCYLPKKGDLLLTTRDPRFLGGFVPAEQGKHVRELERADSLSLLLKSIPPHLADNARQEEVDRLLDNLDDLPLAIAQAAANMTELQLNLSSYIASYEDEKQRATLMQEPFFDVDAGDERNKLQSVYVTWELSFKFLESNHVLSAICLYIITMFDRNAIPCFLLRRLPFLANLNYLEFRAVIKKLLHLSLIEESENGDDGLTELSMHRVIHQVIFDRLRSFAHDRLIFQLNIVTRCSLEIFPFHDKHMDKNELLFARYLLPQYMRQLHLLEELHVVSGTRAKLLQSTSTYLRSSGRTQAAAHLSACALDVAQQVWLPDDVSIFYIRKTMTECLLIDAQYYEAERAVLQCLEMLKWRCILKTFNNKQRMKEELCLEEWHGQALFGQAKFGLLESVY